MGVIRNKHAKVIGEVLKHFARSQYRLLQSVGRHIAGGFRKELQKYMAGNYGLICLSTMMGGAH